MVQGALSEGRRQSWNLGNSPSVWLELSFFTGSAWGLLLPSLNEEELEMSWIPLISPLLKSVCTGQ